VISVRKIKFGIWASGGRTTDVFAESEYLAVEKFFHKFDVEGKPLHTGGTTLGINCAYYTSDNGEGIDVKVWKR